jgi:hypothetical protein
MFDSDLCCAAVSAAGMMVDIGLSGNTKNIALQGKT